jgi:hypothetical protein
MLRVWQCPGFEAGQIQKLLQQIAQVVRFLIDNPVNKP